MEKLKVAVLFGGVSSEYEVSLETAHNVLTNLPRREFEVFPIGITKQGRWFFYSGPIEKIPNGDWAFDEKNCKPVVFSADPAVKGFLRLEANSKCFLMKVDCIFLALHGRNGEDGRLQGFFEAAKIPFVGSGLIGSALCMDKELTHKILESHGIKMAKYLSIKSQDLGSIDDFCKDLEKKLKFPLFIKPANSGSSIGISKCTHLQYVKDAILKAFEFDNKVVCEQAISNCREIECAVIGNDNPVAAECLGEIEASGEFYDYDSKYRIESKLTIPANLSEETAKKVRQIAVDAFKAVGCRGFARVDFLISEEDGTVLNEINTLPGFTGISMFPKLWAASGLKTPQLLAKLVKLALE